MKVHKGQYLGHQGRRVQTSQYKANTHLDSQRDVDIALVE